MIGGLLMVRFTWESQGMHIINVNDYFNLYVTPDMLSDATSKRIMHVIDTAEILDYRLGTVSTPFGITSIQNLSTGCKTALLVNCLCKDKLKFNEDIITIELVGCGWNAVQEVIRACIKESILLSYSTSDVGRMSGKFMLNGIIYDDIADMVFSMF